jgi:3-hydroxyacyl-[acyl-carrier-protein] dehydratase
MDRNQILELLPYGESFCFLDRISELQTGRLVRGAMTYSDTSPMLVAHFSSGPHIVPAVILVEQICQAALLLGLKSAIIPNATHGYIGKLKATFLKPAVAPCTANVTVVLDRVIGATVAFSGEIHVDGHLTTRLQAVSAVVPQ